MSLAIAMRHRGHGALLTVVASSALVLCAGAPQSVADDETVPALAAVAGQGMMNDHAYHFLEELSDQIGGRVTGSSEAQQAIDWGVAKMKAIGLEDVHVEKWWMSRGWKRISAQAELLAPIHRRLSIDSMGWVGAPGDDVAYKKLYT